MVMVMMTTSKNINSGSAKESDDGHFGLDREQDAEKQVGNVTQMRIKKSWRMTLVCSIFCLFHFMHSLII